MSNLNNFFVYTMYKCLINLFNVHCLFIVNMHYIFK